MPDFIVDIMRPLLSMPMPSSQSNRERTFYSASALLARAILSVCLSDTFQCFVPLQFLRVRWPLVALSGSMISDMLSEFLREQTVLPCQSKLDKIYQNCNKLGHSFGRMQTTFRICVQSIDQEFVTSAKKIANFNEFSEIKKNS